jgi:hypothetical protein
VVVCAFLAFLLQVLALVGWLGSLAMMRISPLAASWMKRRAVFSTWTSVTRNSVVRVTLESSEVARIAAMRKAAILTPSGRSRMFATVV